MTAHRMVRALAGEILAMKKERSTIKEKDRKKESNTSKVFGDCTYEWQGAATRKPV